MSTEETPSDHPSETPPEGGSTTTVQAGTPEAGDSFAEIQDLQRAKQEEIDLEGQVIGWNRGGFHIVIGDVTAFCPRSEMELGHPKSPKTYLDKTFSFQVLKVQKHGRRVVVSRAASLRSERLRERTEMRDKLAVGTELRGRVASLTEFGAFVDLGGVQGLVHVSEISHQRIERPEDVLTVGQEVAVKVLKVERGGKRISLSMRALEPNPWSGIRQRFPEGTTLKGKVEKVTRHGAFIELEPGLTGLLPASAMALPREAAIARAYPPGREVTVQVVAVDERRHRVSLAPEGFSLEGTRRDYKSYLRDQDSEAGGFHALADALRKARTEPK